MRFFPLFFLLVPAAFAEIPVACYEYSVNSRFVFNTYAVCAEGAAKPHLVGPAGSTKGPVYAKMVHKHVTKAADCFGADVDVLFALWSGESGFQVNIKNAEGSPGTGFAQLMLGGPVSKDLYISALKASTGDRIPPREMTWVPVTHREKLASDPTCRDYLKTLYTAVEKWKGQSAYCPIAREMLDTSDTNLERSVMVNAVLGVVNHLRSLNYAKAALYSLVSYLDKAVPVPADRARILAAAKMQAGWGIDRVMQAAKAVERAQIKSYDEFDKILGKSRDFDLYARAKEQTFRTRLVKEAQKAGASGEELQKCAPFIRKPY